MRGQFLGQMPKPDVDSITGIAPSILDSAEGERPEPAEAPSARSPKSTIICGSFLRAWGRDFARAATAHYGTGPGPDFGKRAAAPRGTMFQVLAPVIQRQKGEYRDLFEELLKQGFLRARVDGGSCT